MTPLNGRDFARRLRIPAYIFLFLTIALQLGDYLATASPMSVLSPAWRFGALGSMSNVVGNLLFLTFFIYGFALVFADRKLVGGVGVAMAAGAIALFLMSGVFALDAIQLRGSVKVESLRHFDYTLAVVFLKYVAEGAIAAWCAVSAFQSLRSERDKLRSADRAPDQMLLSPANLPRTGGV